MAINKYLLKQAQLRVKQAFMPPEQAGAPPGAPPMDPSMGGAPPQGAPPMDPAMAGGAPPMDPAMAGGAPPMDPAMAGGAPPMDPAMAGGAPPMDPAMGAPPDPTEQIRSVVKDEMQRAMAEAKGGGKGAAKKNDGAQTEVYMHRIQKLMTHLYSSLGLNLPHDILDDPKGQQGADGQQQGPGGAPSPDQGAAPVKTAADNFSVSEKAAGILHLLRLKKD
jgi:hypothetical protein